MRKTIPHRRTAHLPPVAMRTALGMVALSLILVLTSSSQDSKQAPKAAAQPSSQTAPSGLPPIQLDGEAALHHLNQVISWYRHATTSIQSVGLPSDAIYQDNTRNLGAQVVRLAFESAKAESALITAQQKASGTNQPSGETTQQQNLAQLQAKTSAQIDQLQSQIESLNAQIAKTPAARRSKLIAQREALQGQLEVQKALLDTIQKMAAFVGANGEMTGGLEGGINQLAKSIPEVLGSTASPPKPPAAPAAGKPSLVNSGGLISDAMTLYDYMSAMHQIDGLIKETNYTRDAADHLRTPLRDALRATI